MTPNDLDWLTEDAIDLVVDLLGQRAYDRMDPSDPANGPFLDYLAHEARLRLTAPERRELDRQAVMFAERIHRRVMSEREAKRHRVRCVNEAPALYAATDDDRQPQPASDHAAAPTRFPGAANRVRRAPWWDLAVAAGSGRELWDEPPSAFARLPDGVEDGRYAALSVAGDSMAPLLHTGDTVLVRLGSKLTVGRVVVARHPECGYVVKRVGRIDSMRVELTSLNAAYPPLEIPNDVSLVLGTVVLRWCAHDQRYPSA